MLIFEVRQSITDEVAEGPLMLESFEHRTERHHQKANNKICDRQRQNQKIRRRSQIPGTEHRINHQKISGHC